MIQTILKRTLAGNPEFAAYGKPGRTNGLVDYLFADDEHPISPAEAFQRLRWGGQFIFASRDRQRTTELAAQFKQNGFILEHPPASHRPKWFFLPWPGSTVHFFIARKMALLLPGQTTDRFTYHVELTRHQYKNGNEIVVSKQVPTLEEVMHRLQGKWPDVSSETLEKRARKFTDKIFPLFLTRETAILKILREHLPAEYARRVPRAIRVEKDTRGYVQKLEMSWLRNGGPRLSQMEFALQSADLLRTIHDSAGIIHLDLRLDNFVITEHGVGFVDFGSAVRDDEDISQNPLLGVLFGELMRTSQIQRMLDQMAHSGHITAEHLLQSRGRADKAIDVFYLAVQFNSPHINPDLVDFIQYNPAGEEAAALQTLTTQILKPLNPASPAIKSANDILRNLKLIEQQLKHGSTTTPLSPWLSQTSQAVAPHV